MLAAWPARGLSSSESGAQAVDAEPYLRALQPQLKRLANQTPGLVAISVLDLHGGAAIDVNGDWNLPAASVIKIPVMVEVMRQATQRRFTLDREVTLLPADRDCGSGDLCDEPAGMRYSVNNLLRIMIENSDNTATNMLIRLVGRWNINRTMAGLGLVQTHLGDYIRSDGDIRSLRTSANDMKQLLLMIFARELINEQACDVMIAVLNGQRHNGYLPKALPGGIEVAHKTGTLHDTLNDVGIVNLAGAPYVICVLTTHLRDLDDGARLIRKASKATFETFRAVSEAARAAPAALASPTPSPESAPSPEPRSSDVVPGL
jgi:beta-lactamase class A